jgi:hypothetical protein
MIYRTGPESKDLIFTSLQNSGGFLELWFKYLRSRTLDVNERNKMKSNEIEIQILSKAKYLIIDSQILFKISIKLFNTLFCFSQIK